jgi:hypothetical protein
MELQGLFIGLLIGIMIERYLFPSFDMFLEVLTAKLSENIAVHNANIQATSCELLKQYPELTNKDIQEQINAIGFQCQTSDEEEYEYYEDDNKL